MVFFAYLLVYFYLGELDYGQKMVLLFEVLRLQQPMHLVVTRTPILDNGIPHKIKKGIP